MSLRRFNGWEPKRTTTVTEWRDGVPAKWVTETEPEFDANERDNWYALWEYDQALCPQCGRLRSVCENPDTPFNPQIDTCYAVLAQAMHSRKWYSKYEGVKPDRDGYLPTDGATVWVAEDLPPDPVFGLLSPSDVRDSGDDTDD